MTGARLSRSNAYARRLLDGRFSTGGAEAPNFIGVLTVAWPHGKVADDGD